MKPTPGRQALSHFAAAAGIGLTLTALSALLPDLIARQQTLSPQTVAYAVLSLLISGGMAAYGYLTAHQSQLVDTVTGILEGAPVPMPAQAQPAQAQPAQVEQGS
jgi:hypothetical protein